ncbi:MAG: C25 family cysteine peptidase [Verrucomicrobiales bacterium]
MKAVFLLLASLSVFPSCFGAGHWIAVVAPGLEEAVVPLAEYRRGEGWQTTVLTADADIPATSKRIATIAEEGRVCCLVLVGDFGAPGVPAGKGKQGRMTGEPTDLPWSRGLDGRRVETGRLPARNLEEATVMVRKILDWSTQLPTQPAFPTVNLLVGHHGAPDPFAGVADNLIHTLTRRLLSNLPPEWQLDAAIHVEGSPWQVSGSDVDATAALMMRSPATLFAYMGHSDPTVAVSKSNRVLDAGDWRALPVHGPRPGLFLTCGCFSCQVNPDRESLGLAAIRAPGGPPAVIGSHGESAAALGYLAVSGLTISLGHGPRRVGELWQSVLKGIESAPISASEFAMLDMADGSQGKVPLDQQRAEHLEMWMLLGDPAMTVVPPPPPLAVTARASEESIVAVSGQLPEASQGMILRITLERHPSVIPPDLPAIPPSGPERQAAARERRRLANDVVFASTEVVASGLAFSVSLPLPNPPPAKPWTVRVMVKGSSSLAGVTSVR